MVIVLFALGLSALWLMLRYGFNLSTVARALVTALVLGALGVSVQAQTIVGGVGTLTTGGTAVAGVVSDTTALMNWLANGALALFVVGIVIAIGWKIYRFFKPAH